ncbi:hypothetical protein MSPP1_002213 [Malassezia sp. CBS 17886]|nr:hypothetical protein MSPP1_002213 [Malassezia sp. CBS 17886]
MVLCQRRGCGVDFDAGNTVDARCRYHPGAPVFHEGLKSWSCCKDTNKPVMEFDQFLQIKGCASADAHTTETQTPAPVQRRGGKVVSAADAELTDAAANLGDITLQGTEQKSPVATQVSAPPPAVAAPAAPEPEERDPPDVKSYAAGTQCRRRGCNFALDHGTESRDTNAETCRYHRGTPIFHEGSKGYSCCKRRVLDFDDFLQIEPCTLAEHGHLLGPPPAPPAGEAVDCRIDFYETPNDVRVSVFAKAVDPALSIITFESERVDLALHLAPSGSSTSARTFKRTLLPYAAVNPDASSFSIGKVKVDLVLVKQLAGQSWPVLERSDRVYGYGVTFGAAK